MWLPHFCWKTWLGKSEPIPSCAWALGLTDSEQENIFLPIMVFLLSPKCLEKKKSKYLALFFKWHSCLRWQENWKFIFFCSHIGEKAWAFILGPLSYNKPKNEAYRKEKKSILKKELKVHSLSKFSFWFVFLLFLL